MTCKEKKHPCSDCRQCQWCSDDRCRLCLEPDQPTKLSFSEQIELYERLNQQVGITGPATETAKPDATV